MDVRVSGHQVETGEALRGRVAERISAIADRYFSRAIGASVTFGRGPHDRGFTCDIVAPVNGIVLKAFGRAPDAHVAFEGAADKIEKQLRRYVSRLRERKTEVDEASAEPADNADYTIFSYPSPDETPSPEHPAIIAETRVDIPEASVGDAVMLMDLRNTGALMFRNKGTGQFNMVYRREDGTIGWVEPRG
ncbi:ribosome-associated translation inhibitor RaiA [Sphingomonas sp. BN140010]|uniref:Ribosome hibernation promoting factor n=1 Tax=Sphingomonas arvum TaxID=2992113 RepID=A0ABT3JG03_9SPHN|nr:ribosome-associated translation inhibitor RaiA [Sphingomonas sp. BN140010]MCW3797741.1 ribosome-associated translation inhibitor RaiA [Sphingomonas sp. BN140010]